MCMCPIGSHQTTHTHTHIHTYNSYLPVIGVHEMHGRMHPNYWQITILLVVDLCSSLAYFMMTKPLPIASKLPIKTLVARQLPTNSHAHTIRRMATRQLLFLYGFKVVPEAPPSLASSTRMDPLWWTRTGTLDEET